MEARIPFGTAGIWASISINLLDEQLHCRFGTPNSIAGVRQHIIVENHGSASQTHQCVDLHGIVARYASECPGSASMDIPSVVVYLSVTYSERRSIGAMTDKCAVIHYVMAEYQADPIITVR